MPWPAAAPPGGTHVLRLPGLRRRRSVQPDGQVAIHVRRRAQDAGDPAGVRGQRTAPSTPRSWTSLTAHIPGLKVAFPATPYDAKGLMASSLVGTDPVVFFESQRIRGWASCSTRRCRRSTTRSPFGRPMSSACRRYHHLTFGAVRFYRASRLPMRLKESTAWRPRSSTPAPWCPSITTLLESVKKTGWSSSPTPQSAAPPGEVAPSDHRDGL